MMDCKDIHNKMEAIHSKCHEKPVKKRYLICHAQWSLEQLYNIRIDLRNVYISILYSFYYFFFFVLFDVYLL